VNEDLVGRHSHLTYGKELIEELFILIQTGLGLENLLMLIVARCSYTLPYTVLFGDI